MSRSRQNQRDPRFKMLSSVSIKNCWGSETKRYTLVDSGETVVYTHQEAKCCSLEDADFHNSINTYSFRKDKIEYIGHETYQSSNSIFLDFMRCICLILSIPCCMCNNVKQPSCFSTCASQGTTQIMTLSSANQSVEMLIDGGNVVAVTNWFATLKPEPLVAVTEQDSPTAPTVNVSVQIPENTRPGDLITLAIDDGEEFQFVIPEGSRPGDTIPVNRSQLVSSSSAALPIAMGDSHSSSALSIARVIDRDFDMHR